MQAEQSMMTFEGAAFSGKQNITQKLMVSGFVSVWVVFFLAHLNDSCTAREKLLESYYSLHETIILNTKT